MKYKLEHPEYVDSRPYTREELKLRPEGFPERGLYCYKCGSIIPQFSDLSAETERRIRELIMNNQKINAICELRAAVGCPLSWAKTWIIHSGKPETDIEPQSSCPHCGKSLRTPTARQCRHCLADWH